MPILKVDIEDVERLSDIQLTELLKYLLSLEAYSSGIMKSSISVALNINTGDGGEDGRIKWEDGPEHTDFLPSRFVQFQCKATDMGPASCANEVIGSNSNIKPMVNTALQDGATYILFVNKALNEQQITQRIAAIRKKFKEKDALYAETVSIEIYDASKIVTWVNKYLSAITLVAEFVGRTVISGMMSWSYWEQGENTDISFVLDDDRKKYIRDIQTKLSEPQQAIRLIGGSGLGKTRLALETFRSQSEADMLFSKVVYCDMANEVPGFAAQVVDLVKEGIECILIVDNCSLSLHQQIVKAVSHPTSKISLLTLDYSGTDATPYIEIKRMNNEYIKEMLESVYKDTIPDISKIVDFADGFPQMAVLLANARLNDDPEMGSLTDPVLLEKMLWGNGDVDEQAKQVLKAYALFDVFGLEDDVEEEFNFIADNVADISQKECFRHVATFKKRGIIDQKGRFASVVPKPLAIRLSAEYWEELRTTDAVTLIEQDFPGGLAQALCDNVAKLDFMPKVKEIVSTLCGEQRPFGQAEVILSKLGSRLFRSLVEVNPEATMNALYRVLYPMTKKEVLSINGDVRRNIVWSLEKLSFRKSEFQNAARLLLKLAVAENESWSNNATGQFIQLFQTYLSGTEAPPDLRLEIIDEIISSGDIEQIAVGIKALEKAISLGDYMRHGGAENQGSGKPLKDWEPKIWQDVYDYWDSSIEKLTLIALGFEVLKENVKNALGQNIRALVGYGRIDVLDKAINEIVERYGKLWPEAIENIKFTIKYDGESLPDEGMSKLKEWLKILTPDDMGNRLKLIISIPPYTYDQDEGGNYIDQAYLDAEALAKEIVQTPHELMTNLSILLTGEQRQARTLGRIFADEIDNVTNYIEQGLIILKTIELPNPELIIAMMDVLKSKDKGVWKKFIDQIKVDDELVKFLPRFLQTSKPTLEELRLIIEEIKAKRLDITSFKHYGGGKSLDHLDEVDLKGMVSELLTIDEKGAWIALDILSMYTHGNMERVSALVETMKRVLLQIKFEAVDDNVMDLYYYEEALKKILAIRKDNKFIASISENIFQQVFSKDIKARGNIKKIIYYLIQEYGEIVWPILFEHIQSLTPIEEFRMEHILGRGLNVNDESALVNDIPSDKIIELCKKNEKSAKVFAKSINVIEEKEGKWVFSPVALKLIEECDNQKSILSALSSNLNSFFWKGSPIPYYERQKQAFQEILGHKNKIVRGWAENELKYIDNQIKDEQRRNDERDLGIL